MFGGKIGWIRNSMLNYDWFFVFNISDPCIDGIQNHGEKGVDCGGPCPNDCGRKID